MRNENAPMSRYWPETPPAPYDPPQPAPQAAAWRRALKVVGYTAPHRHDSAKSGARKVKSIHPVKWRQSQ